MSRPRFSLVSLLIIFLASGMLGAGSPVSLSEGNYQELMAKADRLRAEGSYAMAERAYQVVAGLPALGLDQRERVRFLKADSAWRALASTAQSDPELIERQRKELNTLANELEKRSPERPSELWVEIQESLGDSWWLNRRARNWNEAWPYYERALAWWAGSTNREEARREYLALVFRLTRPEGAPGVRPYGFRGPGLPVRILENAVKLADTPAERAEANYLLAMALTADRGAWNQDRIKAHFEAALAEGRGTPWYDDALFQYAQWLERQGGSRYDERGNWIISPDPAAALVLYQQLLDTYAPGESAYYREAQRRVEQITAEELSVLVTNQFTPGTVLTFNLVWRNLGGVRVAVYPVDPERDLRFPENETLSESRPWFERVSLAGKSPVFTRRFEDTGGDPAYIQRRETVKLNEGLSAGLYLVEARGGEKSARGWLLVTRAGLVTKIAQNRLHAFAANVVTGEPMTDASLLLWQSQDRDRTRTWTRVRAQTDKEGLGSHPLREGNNLGWLLFAQTREGPSLLQGNYWQSSAEDKSWRIYAFTDRPAYRPEDTVHWKFSALIRSGTSAYEVPSGQTLRWRVVDPRGSNVAEGSETLNPFGSAWGELALNSEMPLGLYQITFEDTTGQWIGSDTLFRLEEYKLPEYKVNLSTQGADGEPATAFLPGDEVEVRIQADYYFGGAVSGASVEAVVTRSPFFPHWVFPRPFPWYYREAMLPPGHGRAGQEEVIRQTLETDDKGVAVLRFPTEAGGQQNWQYTVEARVVDASRREIIGRTTVRVSRQAYFVHLQPQRVLYRPGETTDILIKTLNANDDPVSVQGRVSITRMDWRQVWVGPDGEKISGHEYRSRLQQRRGLFGRSFQPGQWRLESEGQEPREIVSRMIQTDAKGTARLEDTLAVEGYYKVEWFSQDQRGFPIRQDTAVWVASNSTLDIGFRGGLRIVADEDSFRAGGTTPVMITAPSAGRHVWFTVEAGGLMMSRVLRLEGNVTLLNLEVTDAWIPNVVLSAVMIEDLNLYQHNLPVVVPPVREFLEVTVTPEASEVLPGGRSLVHLEARDHAGKPVVAEVALAVFDEAVLYIQPSLAQDPREFFYGEQRPNRVQTQNSVLSPRFWIPPSERRRQEDSSRLDRRSKMEGDAIAPSAPMRGLGRSDAGLMMMASAPMEADFASAPFGGVDGMPEESAVQVRTDFRATAYWNPAIMTDADGRASVEVDYSESLTTWQVVARASSLPAKVGMGESTVQTRLPLIARLQSPRFLVTGDEVILSGVINNNTDQPIEAVVSLSESGDYLVLEAQTRRLTVPPQGQARADFPAKVMTPGEAALILTVRGGEHADAMELSIPVYERGIDKFLAQSGKMTTDTLQVGLNMPPFRPEGASFTILATPSLAATMLDALPYLADYPYGCVEQTMSRFLPAVIVTRTLTDLGLSQEEVVERTFGGITGRKAGDAGKDLYNLDAMVSHGLDRLYSMQRDDGGWGWWQGGDGDPFMTAYVVWGLTLAERAGVEVRADVLSRSREYLDQRLVETERHPDLAAWLLHALSARFIGQQEPSPSRFEARTFAEVWKERDRLNAYSRALLTLSARAYGFEEEASVLARNLRNGAVVETNPQGSILAPDNPENEAMLQTARWGRDGLYLRWSEGATEATAFCLMALLAVEGNSELAQQAANWLIQNRRGAQWSNTRDTAITVLALNRFMKVSGEWDAALDYEIELNGTLVARESIPAGKGPLAASVFEADIGLLREGENTLVFRRTGGEAPLYFSARADFFTLENPIEPAGNVIFTSRQFTLLRPVETLLDGWRETRVPLASGAHLESGDRVEVTLVIEAKNDLEYLVFEDLKAAGMEAVALQSGLALYARELRPVLTSSGLKELPADDAKGRYTGRQRWVYQELRDRQVAAFVDKLPEGFWELRYVLRAETPGTFAAMPVLGHAMYVPEIRANSAEFRVIISD